jgi:CheY-like chemotaxis protein
MQAFAKLVTVSAALFLIIISSLVIAGLFSGHAVLLKIALTVTTSSFNAIILFFFSGLSFLALAYQHKKLTFFFAMVIASLSFFVLVQHMVDLPVPLENYFGFLDEGIRKTYLKRMSFESGLCFILFSLSLVLIARSRLNRSLFLIVLGFTLLILIMAVSSLLGHTLGITVIFKYFKMCVHTSIGFVILSATLRIYLAALSHQQKIDVSGFLFLEGGISISIIAVFLFFMLLLQQQEDIKGKVFQEAEKAKILTRRILINRLKIFESIVMLTAYSTQASKEKINAAYDIIQRSFPEFENFELVDSDFNRWEALFAPYELTPEFLSSLKEKILLPTSKAILYQPSMLTLQSRHQDAYQREVWIARLSKDPSSATFMVGLLNLQTLFEPVFSQELPEGYHVVLYKEGRKVFESASLQSLSRKGEMKNESDFEIFDTKWKIFVFIKPSVLYSLGSPLPIATVIFGLLLASLIAWSLYVFQLHIIRTRKFEELNDSVLNIQRIGKMGGLIWNLERGTIWCSEGTRGLLDIMEREKFRDLHVVFQKIPQPQRETLVSKIKSLATSKDALTYDEIYKIHTGGNDQYIRVKAGVSNFKDGLPSEITSIIYDATEDERVLRQLDYSRKIEALRKLTDGIAQDFKNVLTMIMGNLELLMAHFAGDATIKAKLTASVTALKQGSDLIEKLLIVLNSNSSTLSEKMGEPIKNQEAQDFSNSIKGDETLLIIEENSQVLEITASYLSVLGYQVIAVQQEEDALKSLKENSFIHLLIITMKESSVDYTELKDKLQKVNPHLKILYIAEPSMLTEKKINEPSLTKPYRMESLAHKIRSILGASKVSL